MKTLKERGHRLQSRIGMIEVAHEGLFTLHMDFILLYPYKLPRKVIIIFFFVIVDSAILRFGGRPGEGRFLPQQISLRGFSYLSVLFSQHWLLDTRLIARLLSRTITNTTNSLRHVSDQFLFGMDVF